VPFYSRRSPVHHAATPDRSRSAGITKEKQLHLLDLTEHLVELKNQTSPSPTKCRPQTNEGTKGSKATAAKRRPKERSEAARARGRKLELARALDVSPTLVTFWLRGERLLSQEQWLTITKIIRKKRSRE